MRIARVPDGPTLHFRVESYALVRDIINMQEKHYGGDQKLYSRPPIIVLNKFSSSTDVTKARRKNFPIEAVGETLRSLFDVTSLDQMSNVNKIGRVLLFSRVSKDGVSDDDEVFIDVRHYVVLGSRTNGKRLLDKLSNKSSKLSLEIINRMESVNSSQDLLRAMEEVPNFESEVEEVNLPLRNREGKCNIKLVEIGPRLTLRLLRV
eukprot:CAMPEP_0201529062 /NCGR_PEP_ID=MMETSP0161_2-20130828/40491_1 /ASSEMBLY_ACC=CAM_ASM_000251 /TAXON_ID=180227 /ORGANISM="Neoparamoeba aestuarina, Strain SoJaBio B1-5/56/2" /LENGTH=205 /DNA_ID=CAMNT_0047930679 /DNA_START=188 /DNA_END=801 /DNA_ORIENTATION=-